MSFWAIMPQPPTKYDKTKPPRYSSRALNCIDFIFQGLLLDGCTYSCYIRLRQQRDEEGKEQLRVYRIIFTHFLVLSFVP